MFYFTKVRISATGIELILIITETEELFLPPESFWND